MTWPPPADDPWSSGPPPPSTGAVAWYPGDVQAEPAPYDPPTVPRPVVPPPPPPGPPPNDQRRKALIAVVVGVVVVALGVTIGLVLGTGGDETPVAGGAATPSSPLTAAGAQSAAPVTATATVTVGASSAAAPTTPAVSTQAYSAPGGIQVDGPLGWGADPAPAPGSGNYRDFLAPGSTTRLAGGTFRIGIGNTSHDISWPAEVAAAAALQVKDRVAASILAGPTYTSYLGTSAADIEYTYYNTENSVQRTGFERIWRSGTVTLIIQVSDLASSAAATSALFQQLVASATVS